ncbi:MAG: CHAD domain-containing protein [Elusimicrobia bacterium]|nr:CHAD domain-containing protein [Elusimicrobiota bacterium]
MNPLTDVEAALRWLRKRPASSRGVHEARKSLKRARAVLKLGRSSSVERQSVLADDACRRAARALAPLRDDRVFAVTLEALLARGADDFSREARALGRDLALRARRAEARALARGAAFRRARAALRACARVLAPDVFARAVSASLEDGLRESYRRGRRAYRAARSDPGKGRFHALRKRAKRLLHELEGLTPRPRGARGATLEALRSLTKVLGDENDLALLRRRLARAPDGGAPAAIRRYARKRQRRLRRRSLVLAKRLFAERPASFARGL